MGQIRTDSIFAMNLLERLRNYIAQMAPEHRRREAGRLLIECEAALTNAERRRELEDNQAPF